jgi:hypothetical protein
MWNSRCSIGCRCCVEALVGVNTLTKGIPLHDVDLHKASEDVSVVLWTSFDSCSSPLDPWICARKGVSTVSVASIEMERGILVRKEASKLLIFF